MKDQRELRSVVIVTGGSRGLGRTLALRFGKAGCRVVVNYLARKSDAAAVCATIAAAGGEAEAVRADVRNVSEVEAMVREAAEQWGRIDLLVNNAGLAQDRLLLRMNEEDWDIVLDTNLKGPFLCTRSAARFMLKQRSGHIINIASIVGLQGREGQANYASSKAGLIGLTKATAKELGTANIRVNAVLPGYLATEMGETVLGEVKKRVLSENALGRFSDPGEIAEFVYRLSLMQHVSGQVFNLDSRII